MSPIVKISRLLSVAEAVCFIELLNAFLQGSMTLYGDQMRLALLSIP